MLVYLPIIGITLSLHNNTSPEILFSSKNIRGGLVEEFNIVGECQCTTIKLQTDGMDFQQLLSITINLIRTIDVLKMLIQQLSQRLVIM